MATKWLAERRVSTPRSSRVYYYAVSSALPVIGEVLLCNLRDVDIRRVHQDMRERGLSETTVGQVNQTLSLMCKDAIRAGTMTHNPCQGVKSPPRAAFEPRVLRPSELRALLIACEDDADIGALVATAALTGCRQGELFALTWADVDLDDRTISVTKTVQDVDKTGQTTGPTRIRAIGPTKTRAGRRTVPIPDTLAAILVAHRDRSAATGPDDAVFVTKTGKPYRSGGGGQFFGQWVDLLARAGVPRIRFHDLRHTVGTMVTARSHLTVASRLLGHANPMITARFYAHAQIDDLRQVTASIDAEMAMGRRLTDNILPLPSQRQPRQSLQ